jgi:hypothetical protein
MDVHESLSRLFKQSSPSAHEIVLGFRHYLASAHLSAASINRHLATLRSVTKLGRMLGMMSWYIEVGGVKGERRRDVRGPSVDDVKRFQMAVSLDPITFRKLAVAKQHCVVLSRQRTATSRELVTWICGVQNHLGWSSPATPAA